LIKRIKEVLLLVFLDVHTLSYTIEWINGFLDNTSIFTNNDYEDQNLTELKRRLESDGNKWANLLQATGGKLELNKCFFYLLTWKWDVNGNATPQTIQEQIQQDNTPITIKDIDRTFVNLKQIEVNKSHKTLGVYKCIYGKEIDHLRVLAGKNKEFIRKAWNSQINRRMARRAFNSHYVPSLLYSLAATNIMEDDINNIQQNAMTTFIRIQGYDMTFPRVVIYGPKTNGGIGILKVSVENNCNKLETMVSHTNGITKLGNQIVKNINWMQIISGRSKPVLNSKDKLEYMDNNWFFPVKEYLNKTDMTVDIPK
jgi:hypothetical protein